MDAYILILKKVFASFKNTKFLAEIGSHFPKKRPEKTQ